MSNEVAKKFNNCIIEFQRETGRCFFCNDHLGSCLCCDECHEDQDWCECDD